MNRVRVPDRIVAQIAPGTVLAPFTCAARAGATHEELTAAWPPNLIVWFFENGLHEGEEIKLLPKVAHEALPDFRLERDRMPPIAKVYMGLGYILVLASVPLSCLILRSFDATEFAGPAPWHLTPGLTALPFLPLCTVILPLVSVNNSGEFGYALLFFLIVLPPSLVSLLGFALIARAKRRPVWVVLLGVLGLFIRARRT